jgi:integrase
MSKPKKPLTDRAITAAKSAEPGKRRLLWDAIVPGLALRVTDQGAKSFALITRYPGSPNPAPRSLGTYGAISLAAARAKAQDWLKLIAAGVDPTIRESEKREETFQAIAENYFSRKAKDHRSREWAEATLARLVYPTLGAKPIETISRGEIVRLLDGIEDERGPIMANRTLGLISRIMNWHASRTEFRSPIVRGMARAAEQPRSRILTDDEIRALWAVSGLFGSLVRFILLTATRRNEAAHAKRSEIEGRDWTIPGSRYKTGIDHLIPLSAMALAELPKANGEYVFSLKGEAPIGGFSRSKQRIDEETGVSDWVLHDLRRTARSLMSRAGVPTDHAERCLGHVIPGVRGVYDRHEYHREKALAFEALAAQIERIVRPQENVVPIKGRQ